LTSDTLYRTHCFFRIVVAHIQQRC